MLSSGMRKAGRILRAWAARLPQALAIGLGLAPADPEYAGRLRTAQIAAIVRLTPLTMTASCLNAAILLWTLGRVGPLRPSLWIWSSLVFALAVYYGRNWLASRRRDPNRQATPRTMRRAIIHGGLFGAVWAAVPLLTFPGTPAPTQLLVGCLTAGMMCAGGFALATAPLAGMSYVLLVSAGGLFALLQDGSPVYLGLTALILVYTAVVLVNLNWNAFLFISHFLAEAQIQREIAARERAQAQAAHADRMIALGELAGGIAHDFNNILQIVAGHAELIEQRTEKPGEVRRLARVVLQAAERGGSVSRRLLAFARRDILTAEMVDVAGVLKGVCELLNFSVEPGISLHSEIEPGLGAALADKAQFEAVLLNLATNARDAMPDGGRLTFRAFGEEVAQDSQDPTLRAGSYVGISVADSGAGMDAATLLRATEPFFTTKPKGKGTGLGLSMAQGFAEQSGGALSLRSELGRGTTVTIWLPRAAAAPAAFSALASVPAQRTDHHHRRRVLVVDDDELVREVVVMSLTEAGFATKGAEHAQRALAYLDEEGVDALVTDFAMPGMNGLELIREMRKRGPIVPTILLTGHVGDIAAAQMGRAAGDQIIVLQKPVRPAELVERLAALLEEADVRTSSRPQGHGAAHPSRRR